MFLSQVFFKKLIIKRRIIHLGEMLIRLFMQK